MRMEHAMTAQRSMEKSAKNAISTHASGVLMVNTSSTPLAMEHAMSSMAAKKMKKHKTAMDCVQRKWITAFTT